MNSTKTKLSYPLILVWTVFIVISSVSSASELRCGWLDNPTPGNNWLIDRHGKWEISTQGNILIDDNSMDNLPEINDDEFVRTNVNYGYSCVCLDVTIDPIKM